MKITIMASGDFSKVPDPQRREIYECLRAKNWIKINQVSTTWYGTFNEGITEQDAIQTTISEFKECAKSYEITLAIHAGTSLPKIFPNPK